MGWAILLLIKDEGRKLSFLKVILQHTLKKERIGGQNQQNQNVVKLSLCFLKMQTTTAWLQETIFFWSNLPILKIIYYLYAGTTECNYTKADQIETTELFKGLSAVHVSAYKVVLVISYFCLYC